MVRLLSVIVASYLLGSIPTSIIVGRILRGIDIRDFGSGNAGGTNTFRILGWKPGVFVIAVDVLKGAAAVLWIAPFAFGVYSMMPETLGLIAGCSAISGHIWTAFAGLRGGKGVGTGAGVLLVLYPYAFPICLVVFIMVLLATRTVALSSISAAVSFPFVLTMFRYFGGLSVSDPLYYFSFLAAFLIIFTHRVNIKRIFFKNP